MGTGTAPSPGGVTHWAAVWSTRITPVPLLMTGVRQTIRQGGPTITSADVSVPRLAGFSLIS